MKSLHRILLLTTLFFLPLSAAHAAAPNVAPISNVSINASAVATVNVVAVDLDGDAITLIPTLPAFATLNAPTTGNGLVLTTISLAPTGTDVGTFNGKIKATAGGQADSSTFQIIVAAAGSNQAPVVTAPAVQSISEGANLMFTVTAADVDADAIVSLNATGVPSGATFTKNGANTSGTFSWTPTFTQSGDYDLVFTATSGVLTGAATTHIHVENAVQLSVASISDMTVVEGTTFTVNVNATGPATGSIDLTSSLPSFATLNAPTSSSGTGTLTTTVTISPTAGQAGTYQASVTASASGQTDTEDFTITVIAAGSNQPPVVTAPALQSTTEGVNLMFTVSVADADADAITSLNATGVPSGATFTKNGSNTSGTFSWTPTFTQSGEYDVVFTAASGTLTGAATTHIHVENGVQLSIANISDVTLAEGTTLTVNVNVTGPSTGSIGLTSSLPSFATLNAPTSSSGTGILATTITISPATGQTGTFQASVTASASGQTDTESFTITVTPVGGGGMQAKATLLGNYNTHRKFICFRVEPVNSSFDMRNVVLSGVTLHWGGNSITALAGKTHLSCEDDDEGDGDNGDCDECDDDDDGDESHDTAACDTLDCRDASLHACFSISDIQSLFGDAPLPTSFADATVNGSLSTGETFAATVGTKFAGNHDDKDKHGKKGLHSRVRPNPVNPSTVVTFTLSQPGRVRILIYDLQGRLVKTLLDENRTVGDQTVTWNGSGSRKGTVSSGVYFVHIKAPQGQEVQRVTVLK